MRQCKTYADNLVVVETTLAIVVKKRGEKTRKRGIVVVDDHQIGIYTRNNILLLLVHIASRLEQVDNLHDQRVSLRITDTCIQSTISKRSTFSSLNTIMLAR